MPSLKVKVEQGVVRGCEEKLPDGRFFFRFSGIPYAKPPINELRFKSPQKLLKFDSDEVDCTKERDGCFHRSTLTRKYVGSEDCLNLNVYVPVCEGQKSFAVMVYIHGGRFKYESATKDLYSPEYLLMEDVIVVTINSRQHVLGYLSVPSKGISGNAALKDQQMALQWIYENIAHFNGDPSKICLFGESAGAVCVHNHVMNQKSRRFFSSAICQSGTNSNDTAFTGQNDEDVVRLGQLLGSKSSSLDDVLDTLMKASVKDLYESCDKVLTVGDQLAGVRHKWRMMIEKDSDDAFMTRTPISNIVSQAGQIDLPIIFGTNNGDGMPPVAAIIGGNKWQHFNENFNLQIPRSIPLRFGNDAKALAEEMRSFYLDGREFSEATVDGFVKMRSDTDFLISQTITNDLNVQYHPKIKQFLYEFQFEGRLNLQKKDIKLEHLKGACHADDIFYLFGGVWVNQVQLTEDSREWKMRKLMCKLWTNFAKYHDPTPDHDNPLGFKWTPVEAVTDEVKQVDYDYLAINDDLKMVRNLNKDRMDFWRRIYRKYNREYASAKL